MQPYFMPYAGYFRLFTASDLFVIYDCVQFPRRGWVHRNRFFNRSGNLEWLTLPIEPAPRDTLIRDIQFRRDAKDAVEAQFRTFPSLQSNYESPLVQLMLNLSKSMVDYIEDILRYVVKELGFKWNVLRSSQLDINRSLRGESRILAIAKCLDAHLYVNSSGGQDLYESSNFSASGIELKILAPYTGSYSSIGERLLSENKSDVAFEISSQC